MDVAAAFRSIGITKDYGDLDLSALEVDLQGWNSEHPVFRRALETSRAGLVIEVGTWKGASLLHMHRVSRLLGLSTQFISIDTWLGSNIEHWLDDGLRPSLRLRHGYPRMFEQFLRNMTQAGIMDDVFPLPMTTTAAAHLLKPLGIVADAVYVDAGHQEEEVALDLRLYHDLLRPGGVLFGDDYDQAWPGVVTAVNRFAADHRCALHTAWPKYMMVKQG
jgi:predicted O-methyltransferase YrrM